MMNVRARHPADDGWSFTFSLDESVMKYSLLIDRLCSARGTPVGLGVGNIASAAEAHGRQATIEVNDAAEDQAD